MSVSNHLSVNEQLAQAQNKLIEHLSHSERRYSELVDNLKDTVFQINSDYEWTFLNIAWERVTGYTLASTKGESFFAHFHQEDRKQCKTLMKQVVSGELSEVSVQLRFFAKDNSPRVMELSCRPIKDELGNHNGFSGTLSDITQRINADKKIRHMAFHDTLTGLANRRLLVQDIERALDHENTLQSVLIYLDLDGFKGINDTHGHLVGDYVLSEVARRLRYEFKDLTSLIARIGGDEFVVHLQITQKAHSETQKQLEKITASLQQTINELYCYKQLTIQLTSSIGVVILQDTAMNHDNVLSLADAAMYRSKLEGKNTIRFYDKEFEAQQRAEQKFRNELTEAFEQEQFELYYQPQIDIKQNEIVKVEALIRWRHPDKGIIYPDNFIDHLEESGLIIDVGGWVLERACYQLDQWRSMGIDNIRVSVNVSAVQFKAGDFVDRVQRSLSKYNIPSHSLEIELTESVAIADMNDSTDKMHKLNQLGILIALDDFGTGYSSLAYLKYLPVQTIKIDKSFIHGVPDDGYDAAIVESTMLMAKYLGLNVVAEGVENPKQLNFLKNHDCQLYQGYLHSKPCTPAELENLLKVSEHV